MKNEVRNIKEYIKNNKNQIIYLLIITLLTYFIKIFNYSISIDNEVPVNNSTASDFPWISMGRWGVVLLEKITHYGSRFNPLINNFIMIIFLILSVVLLSNLVDRIINKKRKTYTILILGSFIVTSPVLAEMLNFSLMNAEISIGLFLLITSVYFSYIAIYENKNIFYSYSLITLFISMGIYQAFYPLYIGLISFVFVIKKIFNNEDNNFVDIKNIFKMIVIFVISCIFTMVITKILQLLLNIEPSNYLTNQITWGNISFKDSIINILKYIKLLILPKDSIFFNYSYLIIIIITITYLIKMLTTKKFKFLLTSLAILISLFSPFLLEIIMGNTSAIRTQMNLPFILGLFTMLHINTTNKDYLKKILYTLTILVCLIQIKSTNDLFYSDYNRFKEDVRLTQDIMNKIDMLDYGIDRENITIIFIGTHKPKSTSVSVRGETLGYSFYEWDESTDYLCNFRIYGLSQTLGYNYMLPTVDQIKKYKSKVSELDIYPKKSSIKKIDDVIIVKLS